MKFHKAVDFHIEIPAGSCYWSESLFQPLMLGVCLPYIKSAPWRLRRTPKMLELVRQVHQVFKVENLDPRGILWEFLLESARLSSMPADVDWRMLHFQSKYNFLRAQVSISNDEKK